jgi:hypothetical protein
MGLTTLLRELETVCGESVGEARDDDPEWPWLVKGADLSDSVVSDPGVKCVECCLKIDLIRAKIGAAEFTSG